MYLSELFKCISPSANLAVFLPVLVVLSKINRSIFQEVIGGVLQSFSNAD